jgi:tellurite resistance protein TerC
VGLWLWVVFGVVVAAALSLDLMVFHRSSRVESLRTALAWSAFWVGLGLAFGLLVGFARGRDAAFAYLTAFLVEKALSVDNLFVFFALFSYFGVEPRYQHKVLFWGILGALLTRGVFIFAGVALLESFQWLVWVLGALLVATGAKLAVGDGEDVHPERNAVVRAASRWLPIAPGPSEGRFTRRVEGLLRFTPLALVLVAVESTDVMFAVDSVPAVLAISRDVLVVYSSNIFAILGLRALYFVLAGALQNLRYLRPALALILVLIGVKMLLAEVFDVPTAWSLATVAGILVVATVASLLNPGPEESKE